MTIRRRCTARCKNGRRCLEHLRFDVTWRTKRYRVPVNDYAIPRMEPGKQRSIQSMEEARDWERRFIGEVKAGLDPSRPPNPPKRDAKAEIETVFTPVAARTPMFSASQVGTLSTLGTL